MSKEDTYTKLIQLRNLYKRFSQVSWSIRDAEVRFPMGNQENEEQLLSVYQRMIPEVIEISKELEK